MNSSANQTNEKSCCKVVLLIEDDRSIQKMLSTYLEIEGYQVYVASNGEEGMRLLESTPERPCVVLLDMLMPKVNGWEFLEFQRGHASFASIPVVVVSAFPEIAQSVKPDVFVPKPIQTDALMDAIERYCAA
jgi:CheY-like chemotaxis protein